ncbi:MAG: hydantoinase/oxoprolinase family protein [Rhodospirillaceae bacterium]|nr:hydantoinase/oxoprolinase family protein [Rhodospirillaceae bacterium]
MTESHRYRLGCDIGGTFTDFVLLDDETGEFQVRKVLTTPDDPSRAVETGITDMQAALPGFLGETEHLIHGTTLVINAVIERKGAKTALITTEGFRDSLEMRREIRYDIYDLSAVYPEPLVPRPLRLGVPERLYADGRVRQYLDEAAVRSAVRQLRDEAVESIAVTLLHAYANPTHETRIGEIIAEEAPDIAVSLSSEVMPEIKEFERTATTAVNAYVKPLLDRYVAKLEDRIADHGLKNGLFLMLSGGGVTAPETARAHPVRLIESGPVGGALAAAHLGEQAGLNSVLMFDMGGTTAKSCLVENGRIPITSVYEVDRVHRFKRGSGTPVGVPTVDLIEIGAGGGSIASIDELGLLTVGPQSAGAAPGPVCYGRGGTQPTVTDADLMLGYLNPEFFLGGEMALDQSAAEAALERHIATPMGLTTLEAAWGIHEIVNENMASAMRMYVTEKGGSLRDAVVVAIGGAGPVHAADFARRLGASEIIMPLGAGVYSALGFLVAPFSFEAARTRIMPLADVSADDLRTIYTAMESETAAVIERAVPDADVRYSRAADVCYIGQGAALRIDVPDDLSPDTIRTTFLAAYEARFGAAYDDMPVQIVTNRVTAAAVSGELKVGRGFPDNQDGLNGARKGERPAFCAIAHALIPHTVYAMENLPADAEFEGPAIVEDASSTLVIGDGATAQVDRRGWISVKLAGGGA